MKKALKKLALPIQLLSIFLLLVGAWLASEIHHAKRSNPSGIEDYTEYREQLPEPKSATKFSKDKQEYIFFHGPISPLAFPSSAPSYVFTPQGKLNDWALDPGENPGFQEKWPHEFRSSISVEQAHAILTRGNL